MNRLLINQAVYVGAQGRVVALSKTSGEILWQTRLKTDVTATNIIVDDDRIFAHSGGYLYCIDPENGRVVWENPLNQCGYGDCNLAAQSVSHSRLQAIAV